jgi:hypothetical protein
VSPGRGSLEVADLDDDDEEEEEEEESDDDVRVLASARCCRRRGGDATINIRWEVGGGRVTQGGVEVVAVSERGEPLPPSRRPLRLRRPLRSQRRWPLSFGSEEEVAEMTATAMSSRWLQRKRAVDADESGWGEEEGRRARQRVMGVGRRRTTTTTTTKTQQSNRRWRRHDGRQRRRRRWQRHDGIR